MKLVKHKNGKFSFIGMTEEEASVFRSLVELTNTDLPLEESIYYVIHELPCINYVDPFTCGEVVLDREETKQ